MYIPDRGVKETDYSLSIGMCKVRRGRGSFACPCLTASRRAGGAQGAVGEMPGEEEETGQGRWLCLFFGGGISLSARRGLAGDTVSLRAAPAPASHCEQGQPCRGGEETQLSSAESVCLDFVIRS